MVEVYSSSWADENPTGPGARTVNGMEHRELGRLFREATRLLDATDLGGANETLKAVEQMLCVRRRVFDLGPR